MTPLTGMGQRWESQAVKGSIYTIKEVTDYRGEIGLILKEVGHKPAKYGYGSCRFRPVVKTDISIFQSMLLTPPMKKVEHEPA